ncbi:MAG: RNA polymerase factor sigma-54 [Alphaproteobacteria bacterium]|nr:RNA polymerase factor sigma-54 [Alphaproteobacteria bacterium]
MAITPRLEIKQSQSLLMTQQLRQAINLLQLNNIELNEFIEQELARNPLLEKEDEHLNNQSDNFTSTIDSSYDDNNTEEFKTDIDYSTTFDDYGSDSEGYENNSNHDWSEYNKSKDHRQNEDFDYFEEKASKEKSLYQFINEQIGIKFKSVADKIIATRLSDELDAAGYFRGNINDIAKNLKCSPKKVQKVLNSLKELEPSGIFAENLKECLKIQLKDKNRYDPVIAKLLDNLELLAQGKIKELQKICQVNIDDLSEMISDIKSLNPKPTSDWDSDTNAYIIPDIFVQRSKNGSYRVELNQMSLPRVLINHQYYSELSKHDKQAKRFLKENLSSANFLIKAMHQRATSILRVSEEIVRAQQDFFEHGIEKLKPLNLRDVAYNLEMHESTISRVTSNKYMHTPIGLFELKFFFSTAAGSYIGKEDVSTLAIKHKIKQIIATENKSSILSDDKIVEILSQKGIKIARRTVAKYRESMNIPTSAERKRNALKNI